jgi:hypothetical protein
MIGFVLVCNYEKEVGSIWHCQIFPGIRRLWAPTAAMPHEIERGKQAGFEDYLTKPIQVPEVLKAINQHLG